MEDLKHIIFLSIGILIAFTVVMTMVAYTVLAERRILGFIQGRLGPNRVGPGGFLQPIADLLKFIFKEDIVPDKSTRFVFFLAQRQLQVKTGIFGADMKVSLVNDGPVTFWLQTSAHP